MNPNTQLILVTVAVILVAVGSAISVSVPVLLHVPVPLVYEWTNAFVLTYVPIKVIGAALGQVFAHPAELAWSANCWMRSRRVMR